MADPKFIVPTAVQLAAICDWIYGDNTWKPTTNKPLTGVEYRCHFLDEKQVRTPLGNLDLRTSFASVLRWNNHAVVVFQGTQFKNRLDWLRDLDARPVPFLLTLPGGLTLPADVHAGFLAELDEVLDDVVLCLRKDERVKGLPLLITGHSQGGGEAFLAAAALSAMGFEVAATYTFEAPRAGGEALAKLVKSPVFRFEFGYDIVPHVPPDARLGKNPKELAGAVVNAMAAVAKRLPAPFGELLGGVAKALELANSAFDGVLAKFGGLFKKDNEPPSGLSVPPGVRDALAHLNEKVSDTFKPIVFLLQRLLAPLEYGSLGTLIYVPASEKEPVVLAPTAADEQTLLYRRLANLAAAGGELVSHHGIDAWKARLAAIKV